MARLGDRGAAYVSANGTKYVDAPIWKQPSWCSYYFDRTPGGTRRCPSPPVRHGLCFDHFAEVYSGYSDIAEQVDKLWLEMEEYGLTELTARERKFLKDRGR